jgi:uncharacterized protein
MSAAPSSAHPATSALGAGVGAKPAHWDAIMAVQAHDFWLEVHAENHMVAGGPRLAILDTLRAKHGLSIHGVGLSLAGNEPLDLQHLNRLAQLVRRFEPQLVSEHLAWSVDAHGYFPDLLPAARTPALLERVASRIGQVQDALGRAIAIENPSHYTADLVHDMSEAAFLNDLAQRSGCAIVLDLNNVVLSSHNLFNGKTHWQDSSEWVFELQDQHVSEIHLAGISCDATATNAAGEPLWIDSHSSPVSEAVWQLYQRFIAHAGHKPTLIEWDNDVPDFDELWAQRTRAQDVLDRHAAAL